jgi:hypothetical protein
MFLQKQNTCKNAPRFTWLRNHTPYAFFSARPAPLSTQTFLSIRAGDPVRPARKVFSCPPPPKHQPRTQHNRFGRSLWMEPKPLPGQTQTRPRGFRPSIREEPKPKHQRTQAGHKGFGNSLWEKPKPTTAQTQTRQFSFGNSLRETPKLNDKPTQTVRRSFGNSLRETPKLRSEDTPPSGCASVTPAKQACRMHCTATYYLREDSFFPPTLVRGKKVFKG